MKKVNRTTGEEFVMKDRVMGTYLAQPVPGAKSGVAAIGDGLVWYTDHSSGARTEVWCSSDLPHGVFRLGRYYESRCYAPGNVSGIPDFVKTHISAHQAAAENREWRRARGDIREMSPRKPRKPQPAACTVCWTEHAGECV